VSNNDTTTVVKLLFVASLGYNVKNRCPSTWILFTDVWWCNRSGKISCYTRNEGKNTIHKKIIIAFLIQIFPEQLMLKSYDVFIFVFSQRLKPKFWSYWRLLSRTELPCCDRGGG